MRRSLVLPSHRRAIAQHAAAHRTAPTLTETILWQALSGSKLGVCFRRQVPVGRYIADFLASSVKLIVEVDGGCHTTPAGRRADARRDRYLAKLGYRVVRIPAAMVQHQLAEAVGIVAAALAQQ